MAKLPFAGPSYNLASRPSGVARTINMFPVPQEPGNERTGWVLKDVPGLEAWSTTEIEPSTFFTSWLYPIDSENNLLSESSVLPVSGQLIVWPIETIKESAVIPISGTLDLVLNQYTYQLAETIKESSVTPQSGTLVVILIQYTDQLAETVKENSVTPQSGTLDVVLVSYTNQLAETIQESTVYPVSGTLA